MPPGPAKRSKQGVAVAPQDEQMAGSLSDPAILRQRRSHLIKFTKRLCLTRSQRS
jgi:hypothetical protein